MSTQPPNKPEENGETVATGPTRVAPVAPPVGHLAAGTQLGDWTIDGLIGIGGMGTVYAATHAVIGKRAAIKVVRSELLTNPLTVERFVTEARVVNQIQHPNIIDIFHIEQLEDGRPYLVMELLRGRTLGRRMADGRIPPQEAIDILLQICDALAAAHARGVVHRDLKPDNIFLVDGGPGAAACTVKLVDWGIAKLMDAVPMSASMTTTGTLVGTPQYMSPEQARAKHVDGRTDVYSLGAIAYEMFLEGPPFQADNIADLVTMHLREDPPPPSEVWPDIPEELERLLLAMLAKNLDGRPSVDDIQGTLRRVSERIGTRTRWFDSGRHLPVSAAVPELLDRAPTWGMDAEIPWRTAASGPQPVVAPPRRGLRRAVGAFATLIMLGAGGTVITELVRNPDVIAPAARASSAPAQPRSVDPVMPAVGGAAAYEVPEVAPAMPPNAHPEAFPAAGPVAELPATLDLRVRPKRARVVVDGDAEQATDGRLVRPVAPGVLELSIEAPGFAPYRRTIEIGPGTVMLEVNLQRASRGKAKAPRHQPEGRRAVLDIDPDGTIDPFE